MSEYGELVAKVEWIVLALDLQTPPSTNIQPPATDTQIYFEKLTTKGGYYVNQVRSQNPDPEQRYYESLDMMESLNPSITTPKPENYELFKVNTNLTKHKSRRL